MKKNHYKYQVSSAPTRKVATRYMLTPFMESIIKQLKESNRLRTADIYTSTLNCFTRFRNSIDISFQQINTEEIQKFEAYLRHRNLTRNTTSFYMRVLRAVYNRAVANGLVCNTFPFRNVYTGIDRTIKRAIPLTTIKRIKALDLSAQPTLRFARDMFLFSFYTRGMSFIDIAFLLKNNLKNGILTYYRRKTGKSLSICWEPCMQEIVTNYSIAQSPYLFPIIHPQKKEVRRQYSNALYAINRHLKIVGKMINLSQPLTMHVARHSWASAAKEKNISITVICEAMGHDSETTTQIYLASLNISEIDKANHLIINSI